MNLKITLPHELALKQSLAFADHLSFYALIDLSYESLHNLTFKYRVEFASNDITEHKNLNTLFHSNYFKKTILSEEQELNKHFFREIHFDLPYHFFIAKLAQKKFKLFICRDSLQTLSSSDLHILRLQLNMTQRLFK